MSKEQSSSMNPEVNFNSFNSVLLLPKIGPLEQHNLIKPYIINNSFPVILQSMDSGYVRRQIADVCTVTEYADVVFVDSSTVNEMAGLYSSPDKLFTRFPKLKALVSTEKEKHTIYTRSGVSIAENREGLDSESYAKSWSEKITAFKETWETELLDKGDNGIKYYEGTKKWAIDRDFGERTIFQDKKAEIRQELREAIAQGDIPPFVYTYPPRSAYRDLLSAVKIEDIWKEDMNNTQDKDVSLYLHFPFCKYKCGFCNLYTVVNNNQDTTNQYINAITKQLQQSQAILQDRKLVTIYIGGGTPMLMSQQNFGQIVDSITKIVPNWQKTVEEFCIEASPDSVVKPGGGEMLNYFISRGITRVNLGLQSTDDEELLRMGRPINSGLGWKAIDILKSSGLKNLSTDLIMGFLDQTEKSWIKSVQEVLEKDPETISTYFLTVRPDNRFGRSKKYTFYRDPKLYRWYDIARELITAKGYQQESNVRYIKPGKGGYKQKVYQFHGVPILGLGAGARSYTNTADYIVGGDAKPTLRQVANYMRDVQNGNVSITAGYVYDDEERIRKRFALDMFDIDLSQMNKYSVERHKEIYEPILQVLIAEGLVMQSNEHKFSLTPAGHKYRDIISWMFFSSKVVQRDSEFYRSLQESNLLPPE